MFTLNNGFGLLRAYNQAAARLKRDKAMTAAMVPRKEQAMNRASETLTAVIRSVFFGVCRLLLVVVWSALLALLLWSLLYYSKE